LNRQTPSQSTVLLLCEKLLFLSLSFLVTLAIAKHLSPEFFGQLSFLIALAALVVPLNSLGLNSIVTKEILARPNDVECIVGSALMMRLIAGVVVITITSLTSFFFLPFNEWVLLNVLVAASIFDAAIVVDLWLQAYLANRYGVILRLFVIGLFSIIKLIAVRLDAEIAVFVCILGGEALFSAVLYLALYQHLTKRLNSLKASVYECRQLLQKAKWLFFSGLAAVLYIKIDQVMLRFIIDDSAVGHYAIAAKFTEMWYFIPVAIVTSYFPNLLLQSSRDTENFSVTLQKVNDGLFLLGIGIATLVTVSASFIIPLIFGQDYMSSVPIIIIHTWSSVLVFMRALMSKWLIIQNLPALSLLSQLMGAIVNVGLNLILIPNFGAVGAAYATLISFLFSGYICLFFHSSLWPMALIVSKSLVLPVRLILHGKSLYKN
jgi:O-antigen/teichoic acid export membrane protein